MARARETTKIDFIHRGSVESGPFAEPAVKKLAET
jgi:hypothetical protein